MKDRERLKRQIEFHKRRLQGGLMVPQFKHIREGNPDQMLKRYNQFIDPNVSEDSTEIIQRIKKMQRVLEKGSPQSVSPYIKRKMEQQAIKDKEFLQKNMCPKTLFSAKEKDPEFRKAVEACNVENSVAYKSVAKRYKNTMRQLDPDNPEASNLEALRPN